jgi:cytoskeleton protein RodZ
VRDANQQVLISRVVRGGNTVELTGTSPLQVSLGQANAASVRFDGEIIDISGYTRGNVARFTLGADS